jgi:phosphoglucosamine mutase
VPVADRARVATAPAVVAAVNAAATELGDDGRVLLRPSGTEQIVRVMVEAPTQDDAEAVAQRVAAAVAAS